MLYKIFQLGVYVKPIHGWHTKAILSIISFHIKVFPVYQTQTGIMSNMFTTRAEEMIDISHLFGNT